MKRKPVRVLGIDIGGSKIMVGVVAAGGKVIVKKKIATAAADPAEKIIGRTFTAVDGVLKSAAIKRDQLSGIGLGVPGPLDIKKGKILDPWQLPTLQNYPIVKEFEKRFQIPVFMDNDANCFALGESFFGAGIKSAIIVGFTLGTGLGCGVVINRKVHSGSCDSAGEVWISPYQEGIIEDKLSGKGLLSIYRSLTGEIRAPKEILHLASLRDPLALKAWAEFGRHLAYCIAWSVNLLDPDLVVFGGSISKGYEYFSPSMEQYLRKWINPVQAARLKVFKAGLLNNGGMIGAACLVLSAQKEHIN